MRRYGHGFILALVPFLTATAALPAAPPDSCFCWEHLASKALVRGCEEFRPPPTHLPKTLCYNAETSTWERFRGGEPAWTKLADGEGACDPCPPVSPEEWDRIRGQ